MINVHALRVEFVAARETHHAADAVDVLLETDDALALFAAVTATPFRQSRSARGGIVG
jgi:hypothetical protein